MISIIIFIFSIITLIVISKIIITLIGVIRVVVQEVRPALLLVDIVLLSAVRRSLVVLARAQLNITRANIIFGIFQDLSVEDLEATLFVFSIKSVLTLNVTARRIEIYLSGL